MKREDEGSFEEAKRVSEAQVTCKLKVNISSEASIVTNHGDLLPMLLL